MSQVDRSTAKSYFNTGDVPTEAQFANMLDSIPFLLDYTSAALSGTTWNVNTQPVRELTLSANTALTLTGGIAGKSLAALFVTNPGSYTLTINGVSQPIRSSDKTMINVACLSNGIYYVRPDSTGAAAPDTTPPTVTVMVAIDAHTIEVTFSEMVMNSSGFVFKRNGTLITISGVSSTASNTKNFAITEILLATDTITGSYTPGNIADNAGNPMAGFGFTAVSNSIGVTTTALTFALSATGITHSGADYIGAAADYVNQHALADQKLPASTDGYVQADYASSLNESAILAFHILADDNTYPNYQYGVFVYLASYYVVDDGTVIALSIPAAAGDKYRLIRTSGAVKAQYLRSGTWTALYTFPTRVATAENTADLFININIGVTGNKITNAVGYNVVAR